MGYDVEEVEVGRGLGCGWGGHGRKRERAPEGRVDGRSEVGGRFRFGYMILCLSFPSSLTVVFGPKPFVVERWTTIKNVEMLSLSVHPSLGARPPAVALAAATLGRITRAGH